MSSYPSSVSSSSSDRRESISQRLETVLRSNKGYQFLQHNGQRIFEPLPSTLLNRPSKGCEVFIGNIPKYLNEDVLIPLFQKAGPVYNFRLMLDFNQRNRGYAFASYFFSHQARLAIEMFNGYIIDRGAKLAVFLSVDNRRLFVGNIPRSKTVEEIRCLFDKYVEGLVDVIMYPSWHCQSLNRGFAFLEFENHLSAAVARRQLHPKSLMVWEQPLYVDWADPVPEVDPLVMAQVSTIYVKNLPVDMNNDQIFALFRNITGPRLIRKTHKILTYAFIHCRDRMAAEIVMGKLMGLSINKQSLEIEWARPRQYSSNWRLTQPPSNLCLSVPLRYRKTIIEKKKASRNLQSGLENDFDLNGSLCSTELSSHRTSVSAE